MTRERITSLNPHFYTTSSAPFEGTVTAVDGVDTNFLAKVCSYNFGVFKPKIAIQSSFLFKGWNKSYPFNTGDLVISMNVLYNYLEANNRIPWEDLRYLFGEIMYGGHITDDWDRRLCKVILILSIIVLCMH